MTYWILAIIGLALGAMAWEAKLFVDAHNKSVEKIIKIATEETENILKHAVITDTALAKSLEESGNILKEHTTAIMGLLATATPKAPPVQSVQVATVPTRAEKKKLNIEDYVYSLKYARDAFATTATERKAIDAVITRIKEIV